MNILLKPIKIIVGTYINENNTETNKQTDKCRKLIKSGFNLTLSEVLN